MEKKKDLCERTFRFSVSIVSLCKSLEDKGWTARTLGQQLLRSGTSIGANIEEGQGAQSKADFISKYSIARKEARETNYWLRLLMDSKILSEDKVEKDLEESNEIIAILTAIIKKLRENLK